MKVTRDNTIVIVWQMLIILCVFAALSLALFWDKSVRFDPVNMGLVSVSFFIVTVQSVYYHSLRTFDRYGRDKTRIKERFLTEPDEKKKDAIDVIIEERLPYQFDGKEDVSDLPSGLTLYMTCYDARSYTQKMGKTIRNVVGLPGEQISDMPSFHWNFNSTPTFSRKGGFQMHDNSLSGPYSMDLGIRGDMTYTVFFVAHGSFISQQSSQSSRKNDSEHEGYIDARKEGGTAAVPPCPEEEKEVVIFKMYANTPGLNGFSIIATKPSISSSDEEGGMSTTTESSDMRTTITGLLYVDLRVRIGEDVEIKCGSERLSGDGRIGGVLINPIHKYLFVVVKDMGTASVVMFDLDARERPRDKLAEQILGARAGTVAFSNKDAMINENRNWEASLMAFGLYDRAVSERELSDLFDHYKNIHKEYDPAYIRLLRELRKKETAKTCPFDEKTCRTCFASVNDWTDMQQVLLADEDCKTAITNFCRRNPSHVKCGCWNINHPHYNSMCKTYRCAVGGSQIQPECAPVPPPPPIVAPPPPPPPDNQLTPEQLRKVVGEALRQERAEKEHEEKTRVSSLHHHHVVDNSSNNRKKGRGHEEMINEDDYKEMDGGFWSWLFGSSG